MGDEPNVFAVGDALRSLLLGESTREAVAGEECRDASAGEDERVSRLATDFSAELDAGMADIGGAGERRAGVEEGGGGKSWREGAGRGGLGAGVRGRLGEDVRYLSTSRRENGRVGSGDRAVALLPKSERLAEWADERRDEDGLCFEPPNKSFPRRGAAPRIFFDGEDIAGSWRVWRGEERAEGLLEENVLSREAKNRVWFARSFPK